MELECWTNSKHHLLKQAALEQITYNLYQIESALDQRQPLLAKIYQAITASKELDQIRQHEIHCRPCS